MLFSSLKQLIAALFLVASVAAAPATPTSGRAPVVYLAGDSTMTPLGNNDGTQGVFLNQSISLKVVNEAIAGRSARSYTREGRFTTIANHVKAGDYVIIEFGHNDGGTLTPTDNGRSDCTPVKTNYSTTCQTTYSGVAETVLTYTAYEENATKLMIAKGANVILSTATPDNPWETGTFTYSANRFVGYCQAAATATKATFVDHGNTTAAAFKALGASKVTAFYPHDHTHTSPAGAKVVSQAFITGLKETSSSLKNYLIRKF
ncbi:hypothetical protein MMC25_005955 [Agyrium rufum]|nr:hypothetical protein [Agyrium rufum]